MLKRKVSEKLKNWTEHKDEKCLVVHGNSLSSIIEKDITYAYKFADSNIGVSEDGIVTLPLYMVVFI